MDALKKRGTLLLSLLLLSCCFSARSVGAQDPASPSIDQQVIETFRSAMEAWGYEQYGRLWEMGTKASRSGLTPEDFTDRMRRGTSQPAVGTEIAVDQVISALPGSALLYVQFGLRDRHLPRQEITSRPFMLSLEDGAWRVNLWDFVGLANYFPPQYLPPWPTIQPAPSRQAPAGSWR